MAVTTGNSAYCRHCGEHYEDCISKGGRFGCETCHKPLCVCSCTKGLVPEAKTEVRPTNVVALPVRTSKGQTVESTKLRVERAQLATQITIGYDAAGVLVVLSSEVTNAEALWMLECAKLWVMREVGTK